MGEYRDRWIECTDSALLVRGYYFPWGTKRIPYGSINSVDRFYHDALAGEGPDLGLRRLQALGQLRSAAPQKSVGFFLDVGRRVIPFLTPDDPDAFERAAPRPRSHPAPAR